LATSDLHGRVALVTGASRGIGRAIALALADAGAHVAVADLHPEPFSGERYYRMKQRVSGAEEETSTADAVRALGRKAAVVAVDVSNPGQVELGVAECQRELGPIDVLVNNAGIVNNIAPIAEMDPDAWAHELGVNLTGAFHCVRVVAPGMASRGFGRVINIASIAARVPSLGQPAYSASKAGLVAFTQSVAQEFGRAGVTANAILPGLIGTPLVRSMPEPIRDGIVAQTAVGRLGEPKDIGSLVAYLASPEAGFITATAIPCDGGYLGAPVFGLQS
jgi:NAD(P)-dependent dehydrogenase (short-subunit alcohol dehydrogenase family)